MKYTLYVNGTPHARLTNINRLKELGLAIKKLYEDAIISIEDKVGNNIHYFF